MAPLSLRRILSVIRHHRMAMRLSFSRLHCISCGAHKSLRNVTRPWLISHRHTT